MSSHANLAHLRGSSEAQYKLSARCASTNNLNPSYYNGSIDTNLNLRPNKTRQRRTSSSFAKISLKSTKDGYVIQQAPSHLKRLQAALIRASRSIKELPPIASSTRTTSAPLQPTTIATTIDSATSLAINNSSSYYYYTTSSSLSDYFSDSFMHSSSNICNGSLGQFRRQRRRRPTASSSWHHHHLFRAAIVVTAALLVATNLAVVQCDTIPMPSSVTVAAQLSPIRLSSVTHHSHHQSYHTTNNNDNTNSNSERFDAPIIANGEQPSISYRYMSRHESSSAANEDDLVISSASSFEPSLIINSVVAGGSGVGNLDAMAESESVISETGLESAATTSSIDDPNGDDDLNLLQQPFDYHANMPVITKRELANAIKQATATIQQRDQLEQRLYDERHIQATVSAAWLVSSMFFKPSLNPIALNQTDEALIAEETMRLLAKQFRLNRGQVLRGLPLISVDQTTLGKSCPKSSKIHTCSAGRFRSLSGHCNNVQNPDWGSAFTALVRYTPAKYEDHVSQPARVSRTPLVSDSSTGSPTSTAGSSSLLPSSRAVSLAIYQSTPIPPVTTPTASDQQQHQLGNQHSHMTTMMSFFGQFIYHDLVHVGQYTGYAKSRLRCCPASVGSITGATSSATTQHPECYPIEYSSGPGNYYCLDYVRSLPSIRIGCNLGQRDQLNQVTSYLDGSVIYGSSEQQLNRLRTFVGGRLRSQRLSGMVGSTAGTSSSASSNQPLVELLPAISQPIISGGGGSAGGDGLLGQQQQDSSAELSMMERDCRSMAKMKGTPSSGGQSQQATTKCFISGDHRVNENIGLTMMHTIWFREHNQIADRLAQLNKNWSDERLFEEARRVVVAQLQHITYQEFLPSIIGDDIMQRFNLTLLTQGYYQGYDPQLNVAMSNEVATAVLPFILSTIPSALEKYSDRLEMLGMTSLADTFMDGSDLYRKNKFSQYLMGMMSQNAMEPVDGMMTMTSNMLSSADLSSSSSSSSNRRQQLQGTSNNGTNINTGQPPLIDMVALTIQQGRDHGLKSYTQWRRLCQLKPQINNWHDLQQVMPVNLVKKLSRVYNSVHDLDLYLGIMENPLPGATIGATFACLLARQFYHIKHGDRYWFENDLPDTAFTPKQLEQIRQTTLAKVICRNSQSSISFIQPLPMLTSDPYLNAYQYCTNKAMNSLDLSKWRQPITSAQQFNFDELAGDLDIQESSLANAQRLWTNNAHLISKSLIRARRQLDELAYKDTMMSRRRRQEPSTATTAAVKGHPGYRYLPRPKRQALRLNNQSLIFELATNDVVRSLVRQGRDREAAQSIQADIRDFLTSLETIQLDNLLENAGESTRLQEFIATAGEQFLPAEQRSSNRANNNNRRPFVRALGRSHVSADHGSDAVTASGASAVVSVFGGEPTSSISSDCQDDDRAYPCDHTTPFRTITGWCNNLNNPKFGQSFTPLDRILPNAYDDGLGIPRKHSVLLLNGQPTGGSSSSADPQRILLPSARQVSTSIHDDKSHLHARYSLALMQFGQFGVDHDLTRTPFSVSLDGSLLDCSPCDSQRTVHRDCLPIPIPDDDHHFQSARARELTGDGAKCLHFVRSMNGQTGLGPRQQFNALTAYIDASNVYGSDNCEAKSLRSFSGGRLNSSTHPMSAPASTTGSRILFKEILPTTRANPECVTPNGLCFHAGDQRASEQPGLTAIHTVFLRLHNSIVDQLRQINKHWNDERLYQHGRRIVSAINQRITYNEFAPRLLGLDYMSKYDLILKNVGYYEGYDESCSASIFTEFAAAAFRMGHSLIRGAFPLLDRQYKPISKPFQLRKAFFNSQRILTETNLIDSILRGIVTTPIETLDNSITEELTNHLFEKPKLPFSGMDLISLNIQRARDHGIAGYNSYRVKCNLTRAKSFDDLTSEIPIKLVKRLAAIYESVDDIDLFSGGISETPVHGGIIGPTFGCIIGMQFSRLRRCDRFWHETNNPWIRFSPAQLAEIRKMTLAKVFCDQSDSIDAIQKNAMDISDHYLNPRIPCSSLPSMDLSAWRENLKSCLVDRQKLDLGQSKRINPCRSCTCTMEGPICRTIKINCLQAMKSNQLNAILTDKACAVQCSWALDIQGLA